MKKIIVVLSLWLLLITNSLYSKESYACNVEDQKGNRFYLTDVYLLDNSDGKLKSDNFPTCTKGDSTFDLNFEDIKTIEFIGKIDVPIKDYILANVFFVDGRVSEIYFSVGDVKHRFIFGGMSKTIGCDISNEIGQIKRIEFLQDLTAKSKS